MSFHETAPLEMEWFGGLDSSTPPNDLPAFAAVTANNCVFLESAVGLRPGFTQELVTAVSGAFPASGINSVVPVITKSGGVVVKTRVLLGFEGGQVQSWDLGTPSTLNSVLFTCGSMPTIMTAAQFYQRAVVCRSSALGYGEFSAMIGDAGYGSHRTSRPAQPTLSTTGSGGQMTEGRHWVALSARYLDGSEGAIGEPQYADVLAGGTIPVSWTIGQVPAFSHVTSIEVWVTTADNSEEFRRYGSYAPLALAATITWADEWLITLELIKNQGNLRSPRWPALTVAYAGRLACFGERHRAVGGWRTGGSQGTDFGLGRTAHDAGAPGGWNLTAGTGSGTWFGAGTITFDGVAATPARLVNKGEVRFDLPAIAAKTTTGWSGTFGVRIAYAVDGAATSGSLKWGVTGTSGETSYTLNLAIRTPGVVYIAEQTFSGAFSDDIKLFYEGVGPGVNGVVVSVFGLECFDPTNTAHRASVWWSEPLKARAIDDLTGGQTFDGADGETAWLGFEWQGKFYVAKETSLWVTIASSDTPNNWPKERVSGLIGACGRRAHGHGPDFEILVNRNGVWLFQGSAVGPDGNLAEDIPVEWDAINWAEAWQIGVDVDEGAKRVYIRVPTGTSTFCNAQYVLDYHGGFGPATEAAGRRWSVWPLEARGGAMVERPDSGRAEYWISRYDGAANSYVGFLDTTVSRDWSTTDIAFLYETGKIGSGDGGLALFRKLALVAEGNGILSPALVKSDGNLVALAAPTLYTPMRGTQPILCNVTDERVSIRLATAGTGAKVLLHRLALWMRAHPFGVYRARTP